MNRKSLDNTKGSLVALASYIIVIGLSTIFTISKFKISPQAKGRAADVVSQEKIVETPICMS